MHWFVQMLLGVHFMHGNRVLHRDLKTQNIFLLSSGRLVLGDLGISKRLDATKAMARTQVSKTCHEAMRSRHSHPARPL